MERTGYARLYATVTGTVLVLAGFIGLLVNSEFDTPELTGDLLFYPVNGWSNLLHVGAGLLGLLLARPLPRLFSLVAGIAFTGLGVWGLVATDGTLLFDVLPATRSVNLINLAIGLTGLAAFTASRWDRISAWGGGLGGRLEARREANRQRRRRRQVRKRRAAAGR